MRMIKISELQVRSENQLNCDLARYIKALEKAKPLSKEWIFLQHMIDSAQAERTRRNKHMRRF